MKRRIGHILLLLALLKTATAQHISRIEYFINTDPGFGNGSSISFTPSGNVSNLTFSPDISSLPKGVHHLYVRSLDDAGSWSLTNHWMLVKDIASGNLAELEYFIDTDPGFGNGTDIPFSPSANITNLLVSPDISSLAKGIHTVFIRARDDAGKWSLTNRWMFLNELAPVNVSKAEFFIDSDPGFGNGTDVAVSPALNISNISIPVDINSLSGGMHTIYLRTRDLNGRWSITNRWVFVKDVAKDNVAAGEYFFDTDPGFGNGTAIPFGGSLGTNVSDFAFAASLTGLPNGPHYLFVRTLEANGKWSLTNVIPFDKNVPLPVKLIYFDVKPDGRKAHLSWQTATEQNSDRFEIERSINGLTFEKIGSVKAAGNSNTHTDYSYYDNSPEKGINYYRLKEVDIDNSLQYSETKSVRFGDDAALILYNNPTSGSDLVIQTSVLPSTLQIFDVMGKKMKEVSLVTGLYSLSISGFAAGTYLAVLSKDGRPVAVEWFVVIR
ncbi:MAG TPA: T9SS type A sorting domain-containing protein [Ferruginibacter sp.]|nr:T9SS type A sorting domain-containing protein [Ferruginibacter sp.]